jgi:hypothetical protein
MNKLHSREAGNKPVYLKPSTNFKVRINIKEMFSDNVVEAKPNNLCFICKKSKEWILDHFAGTKSLGCSRVISKEGVCLICQGKMLKRMDSEVVRLLKTYCQKGE